MFTYSHFQHKKKKKKRKETMNNDGRKRYPPFKSYVIDALKPYLITNKKIGWPLHNTIEQFANEKL